MATCIDCIHQYCCKYDRFFGIDDVENKCNYFKPTADVQEVKHGKWIDVFVREVYIPTEKTTIALTEQKCSCCNVVTTFKGDKQYLFDFNCPNCGADMGREL